MTAVMRGVTFPAWHADGGSFSLVELIVAVGPWVLGRTNWSVDDCEFSSGSRGSTRLAQLASSRGRIPTLELVDLVPDQVQLIDGEVACFEKSSNVAFLRLTSVLARGRLGRVLNRARSPRRHGQDVSWLRGHSC